MKKKMDLPEDVFNFVLFKFLTYEERMNLHIALPREMRTVNKWKKDSCNKHDILVVCETFCSMLKKFERSNKLERFLVVQELVTTFQKPRFLNCIARISLLKNIILLKLDDFSNETIKFEVPSSMREDFKQSCEVSKNMIQTYEPNGPLLECGTILVV